MTFKGIITAAMPVASGTSKSGKEWRRASYILQYDNSNEQYPKSVLFDVMGDKIEQLNIKQGVEYEVEVDFSCREYNGRTYMSASCWKATPMQQAPKQSPQQNWEGMYPDPAMQSGETQGDDDLLF